MENTFDGNREAPRKITLKTLAILSAGIRTKKVKLKQDFA